MHLIFTDFNFSSGENRFRVKRFKGGKETILAGFVSSSGGPGGCSHAIIVCAKCKRKPSSWRHGLYGDPLHGRIGAIRGRIKLWEGGECGVDMAVVSDGLV